MTNRDRLNERLREGAFQLNVAGLLRDIEDSVQRAKDRVVDGDIEDAETFLDDIDTQLAEVRRLIAERADALAGDQ